MISKRLLDPPPSLRSSLPIPLALALATMLFVAGFSAAPAAAQTSKAALEAGRLNNIGVALMNQQLTEKAAEKFVEAQKADPSAAVPVLNQGIALLYLQKLPEAEAALNKAAKMSPSDPHVWYALGLAHLDAGNPKLAIGDMERVVKLDPADADAHYFLGSFYLSLADYTHAKQE